MPMPFRSKLRRHGSSCLNHGFDGLRDYTDGLASMRQLICVIRGIRPIRDSDGRRLALRVQQVLNAILLTAILMSFCAPVLADTDPPRVTTPPASFFPLVRERDRE